MHTHKHTHTHIYTTILIPLTLIYCMFHNFLIFICLIKWCKYESSNWDFFFCEHLKFFHVIEKIYKKSWVPSFSSMNLSYFMFWGCYFKLYDIFFPFYKRRLTVLIHRKIMLNTESVNDWENAFHWDCNLENIE